MVSDGGLFGRTIAGRLFNLNTLLTSSLYVPGLAILTKWEWRKHATIFVATSLSSVGNDVAVLIVLVVVVAATLL